jgi:probable phosphoglycerate mutase
MELINKQFNAKIGKTIHLIRHGQTDFNKRNIIQGSGINSDLNSEGQAQAKAFFEGFKAHDYDHVYTSKLKRAIQSVQGFIDAGIPHTTLAEFNEINWGIMEGRESSEATAALFAATVSEWQRGNIHHAVEMGETPYDMFQRQAQGIEWVLSQSEQDKILICMHGRAIRSFLCLLTHTPLHLMEQWEHSNLCLYELVFDGYKFEVTKANSTAHLSSIQS